MRSVIRTAAVAVVAVVVAVAAASCSGPPPPAATSPASSGAPAPTATSDEVPQILRFQAPLLGGGTFDGATLAGRDVALWFWAPW